MIKFFSKVLGTEVIWNDSYDESFGPVGHFGLCRETHQNSAKVKPYDKELAHWRLTLTVFLMGTGTLRNLSRAEIQQ